MTQSSAQVQREDLEDLNEKLNNDLKVLKDDKEKSDDQHQMEYRQLQQEQSNVISTYKGLSYKVSL